MVFVACMRKLLTTLNSMLKHRTRWQTEQSQHACQSRQLLIPNPKTKTPDPFVSTEIVHIVHIQS